MHNFTAHFRKAGDFYYRIEQNDKVAFFQVRTVKGAESNIFTYKLRS